VTGSHADVSSWHQPAALAGPSAGQSVLPETSGVPADQPLIAETLARYATSLKYEDLPVEVVREAKR
jgi:hypothetical protein